MFRDQAAELRNLVRRSARGVMVGPAPILLAVAGGKGGVGTTTLALNLALAISELGSRMVLADMNVYRADIAPLCGLSENTSVADVLEARRDVHEALQAGPGGVQILPGVWAPSEPATVNESAINRLLSQLRRIGRHAEVVMLDLGSGSHDMMRQLWSACDMIVLVTTPDDVSVMDAYATIKTVAADSEGAIFLAINQVTDLEHAENVFARLANSCQRFLMRHIDFAGKVPRDEAVEKSSAARVPLWIHAPQSPATASIREIAQYLQPRLTRKTESVVK